MFTYGGNFDLNRRVILGGDESVSSGALSGDVEVYNLLLIVLHLQVDRE